MTLRTLVLAQLLATTALAQSVEVALLVAEDEYEAARTVPAWADEALAGTHGFRCTYLVDAEGGGLTNLDALERADLLVVFARRRTFDEETLAAIQRYARSDRPIVGIRTASHAFQNWLAFDGEVLGGSYHGHRNNRDARTFVRALPEAAEHPIVAGLAPEGFASAGSLYESTPLAGTTTPLLVGRVEGQPGEEPVAWTNVLGPKRVFYTSLGHPRDFELAAFRRLLLQGTFWALDLPPPAVASTAEEPAEERLAAGRPLTPAQALAAFAVADGVEITLACAEPTITQPVEVQFDDRGRMWVVQYRQYMYPAGLAPLAKDEWDRTTYDRVPAPPPNGPRGADAVTILTDVDGDGFFETARDFVDGLNLATSVALGHGGVWVAQTPYLLFYPDADRDDVPDSDPRVVLEGFGMEDAHAVVNSLTWGPDGWLYGAQGSTCTAHVRGHVFQQAAWRYHPGSDRFEVFAEGGGNTFGLEFDEAGELLTGTNWGGFTMVHYVQGGYYFKNFGKHGPLSNPYAYGHLEHCPHEGEAVGHVAQVGLVYRGSNWPREYVGKWVMPHLLGNRICLHGIERDGSSYRTRHDRCLVTTPDRTFRPVDVTLGPDGALYVADWVDARATHLIPEDTWDKTNGRIWRVGTPARENPVDLDDTSPEDLVSALVGGSELWARRHALRLIDEEEDPSTGARLRGYVNDDEPAALWALWGLYATGGLDDETATALLDSCYDENLRTWILRLCADDGELSWPLLWKLVGQVNHARHARQLASSAGRLTAMQRVRVLEALRRDPLDWSTDPHVPLLLWWAIEPIALSAGPEFMELFEGGAWSSPLIEAHLGPRLARRCLAEGTAPALERALALLQRSTTHPDAWIEMTWAGLDEGAFPRPPARVLSALVELGDDRAHFELSLQKDRGLAAGLLMEVHTDFAAWSETLAPDQRLRRISLAAAALPAGQWRLLLSVLDAVADPAVRCTVLDSLARYDGLDFADELLRRYPALGVDPDVRLAFLELLSRGWADELVAAVEDGVVAPGHVPYELVERLRVRGLPLADRVAALWGDATRSAESAQEEMARVGAVLDSGTGDADRGRAVFADHCARCHALHGEGAAIGPDLTDYERANREFLLLSIVDPGAAIREGYEDWILRTVDGQILTGFLVDETPRSVTLADPRGERVRVAREDIDVLQEAQVPRMPAGLLAPLSEEELRDLFAYLRR